MTEKYNVSIIIPTWNATQRTENDSPTIYKTVESINKQVVEDFKIEVIFVDDMSTDDTVQLLQKLIEDYPKINGKLLKLSKKAGSPYVGWNLGTDNSQGEYVMYADFDDFFGETGSLRDMFIHARQWDSDVVIGKLGDAGRGADDNRFIFGSMEKLDERIIDPIRSIAAYGTLYRKMIFQKYGIKYGEDLIPRADMHFLSNVFLTDNLKTSVFADRTVYYWNKPEQTTLSEQMRKDDSYVIKRRSQLVRIMQLFEKSNNSVIKARILDRELLGIGSRDFFLEATNKFMASERISAFYVVQSIFKKEINEDILAYVDEETYYLIEIFRNLNYYEAKFTYFLLKNSFKNSDVQIFLKHHQLVMPRSLAEIVAKQRYFEVIIGKQSLNDSATLVGTNLVVDRSHFCTFGKNRIYVRNRQDTRRNYYEFETMESVIDLRTFLSNFQLGEKLDFFWETETDDAVISIPLKMSFLSRIVDSYYKVFKNYKGYVTIKKNK